MHTTLVLFRQDLRLADNPALYEAAQAGAVVPVYVLDDTSPDEWRMGGASRWWLHHSLTSLAHDLTQQGSRLILRRGELEAEILRLAQQTGAQAVVWNCGYEPFAQEGEKRLADALQKRSVATRGFHGNLLFTPGSILTKAGQNFSVFTPFWRTALQASPPAAPMKRPRKLAAPSRWPSSDKLASWKLLPTKPDWSGGLRQNWKPGEATARQTLSEFIDDKLSHYGAGRDRPAIQATSRLSPHLHWGEISPRQIWHAVQAHIHRHPAAGQNGSKFLSELGWREFSYNVLYVHSHLPERNLRQNFDKFPWRRDAAALKAWQRGRTGYPIVDAGMRELWHSGTMHNRVRMIVASFLIKHLLIDWRHGERWFWDTLVDADLANNAFNWQWVAGSGADAAPYFRIFNPVLQGEKFDAKGEYVARFVPELKNLDPRLIHAPWRADAASLKTAGVVLGKTYPKPMVDHDAARQRALAALAHMKTQVKELAA